MIKDRRQGNRFKELYEVLGFANKLVIMEDSTMVIGYFK